MPNIVKRFREKLAGSRLFIWLFSVEKKDKLIRDRLERFDKLGNIDAGAKQQLRDHIASSITMEVKAYISFTRLFLAGYILFCFFIAPFYFRWISLYNYLVDIVYYKISPLFKLSNNVTTISFYVTIIIIIFILLFLAIKVNRALIISFFLLIFILDLFILFQGWNKESHFLINGIAAGLLFWTLILFLFLILIYIVGFAFKLAKSKYYYSFYPLDILINTLLLILYASENIDNDLVEYKRGQLKRLEEAAKCIENYLPRRLQCGDIVTESWLRGTAKQLAAALREKKKWIITPKEDTYDFFVKSIVFTLISIVNDNWDALERMEPEKLTLSQLRNSILIFLWRLLRIILIVGLPIVGIWVFQQTPFAFTGSVREYVIVGLFIWELLTFVVVLDPSFGTKISALKDVMSLLFPSKTDNS